MQLFLDGSRDNAFPWTINPSGSRDHSLPMSPGVPPTPGISINAGLLSPGYFAGTDLPRTPGISGLPQTPLWPPTPGGFPLSPSNAQSDPPRPPRDGYEWVWFPDGYWAERELADSPSSHTEGDNKFRRWKGKSSSTNKSQGSTDYSDLAAASASPPRRGSGSRRGSGGSVVAPTPLSHNSFRTERDLIQSLQSGLGTIRDVEYPGETPSPISPFGGGNPGNPSPAGSLGGSSPSSTIRGFRRGSWPEGQGSQQGTPTIPEEREEDASTGMLTPRSRWKSVSMGKDKRKARSHETTPGGGVEPRGPQAGISRKTEHTAARKWFNKVPWRRKEPAHESPILSQIEEEPYVSRRFWTDAYPGGEARRVTTPPLKEATAEGKVRSLFSEVDNFTGDEHIHSRSEGDNHSQKQHSPTLLAGDGSSPGGGTGTETASSSSTRSSSRFNAAYRKATSPEGKVRHWFDQMSEDDAGHHRERREKREKASRKVDFHLNIPEHLPSSPLCPANPKHISGGTGVCVYHGRKHEGAKLKPFRAEMGMQQPRKS